MDRIAIGSVGIPLEIILLDEGSPANISTATTKTILLKAPSGAVKTVTAVFTTDGTDGAINYPLTAADGIIDEVGTWQYEAKITLAGSAGPYYGDILTFDVFAPLGYVPA